MKLIFSKKFIKYFVISFLVITGILLLNFTIRYSEDIFNKGIPTRFIVELYFTTLLTFLGLGLLFGTLIASIFTFKYFSINKTLKFRKELTSGLFVISIIALMFFGYNNWVLPKANLEMTTLLYNMRRTLPNNEMHRVDKDLFRNYHSTMTIKSINLRIESLNIEIDDYKRSCDSVLNLLPDSIALANFNSLKLVDYKIVFSSSHVDTLTEKDTRSALYYLNIFQNNLSSLFNQKQKFIKEITERIVLPLEFLLLFLIGSSFGYYYNDQKKFLLVILGIFTINFFHGTIIGFERMISQNIIGDYEGTAISLLFLLIITMTLIIISVKKEKNTQPNNRYEK